MKKVLLFSSGFVSGIIATFLVAFLLNVGNQSSNGLYGLTVFAEKGECIKTNGEIKIFQVLKPNMALANTGDYPDDIVVLLVNDDGMHYYDDQKIIIPSNKCLRQIGRYQYTTNSEMVKTVPAVVIE